MVEAAARPPSAKEHFVQPNQLGKLPAGRFACRSIADEGEGMDQETLQRATERFFTTKGKGTGLGLSMVHGPWCRGTFRRPASD
jgi:nitrogen fixation/metabolism regulation signal transduction histidine kinase